MKGLFRCQEKPSPKTKRVPKMDEECRFPPEAGKLSITTIAFVVLVGLPPRAPAALPPSVVGTSWDPTHEPQTHAERLW